MPEKKVTKTYLVIKALIRLFTPKMQAENVENLPEDACIIVGNHAQLYGPIACELYSPRPRQTWCAGQMMVREEVSAYAYQDFWSQKPAHSRWFYRILSRLITPLSVCVFNNAQTIGVWHDGRIMSTFRKTVEALKAGEDVVVFPEYDLADNNILCAFQDKFIDVARLYYKRTGVELSFVPLYIAPRIGRMIYGAPIRFDASASMEEERRRICSYLSEEITAIARALPEHTVIPYRNIPKKYYPSNKDIEAKTNAQACR